MTIYVKDPKTSDAVRKLAKVKGTTLTEAIRDAVNDALARHQPKAKRDSFLKLVKELQAEVAKYPKTGLKADKAFFDELSGEF